MLSAGLPEKKLSLEEPPTSVCTTVSIISINKFSRLPASASACSLNTDTSGICQKSFSWPGFRLIFLSSVVIQTRSPCECFVFLRVYRTSRLRLLISFTPYSWGQSAGALSITAHLATTPVKPPFNAAIFVRVCDPKRSSGTLNTLLAAAAIGLHVPHLQDRQPETSIHLRPLGTVHRMQFGFGHFRMSPCCSICHPHGCYQHHPCSLLSQRSGPNLEY